MLGAAQREQEVKKDSACQERAVFKCDHRRTERGHSVADRSGLYIMVFVTMLNSCSASTDAEKAVKELKRIADAVALQPAMQDGAKPAEKPTNER